MKRSIAFKAYESDYLDSCQYNTIAEDGTVKCDEIEDKVVHIEIHVKTKKHEFVVFTPTVKFPDFSFNFKEDLPTN